MGAEFRRGRRLALAQWQVDFLEGRIKYLDEKSIPNEETKLEEEENTLKELKDSERHCDKSCRAVPNSFGSTWTHSAACSIRRQDRAVNIGSRTQAITELKEEIERLKNLSIQAKKKLE